MNRLWLPRGFYGLAVAIGPASVLRVVGIDDATHRLHRLVDARDPAAAVLGDFVLPATSTDEQGRAA